MNLAQIVYNNPFEKWLWDSGLGWWTHGIVTLICLACILVYAALILDEIQIKVRTTWERRRKRKYWGVHV